MSIKIGDKVKTIGFYKGITGVVTDVVPGFDVENHGFIDIQVIKADPKHNLAPGDIDNFVHFNWEKAMKVIKE